MECSICLGPLRHTRAMKRLACGHEYHGACLNTWVESGGGTCPLCRNAFIQKFRVTVTVENVSNNRRVESDVTHQAAEFLNSFHLEIEEETLEAVGSLLEELGFHVDTSVLDAE